MKRQNSVEPESPPPRKKQEVESPSTYFINSQELVEDTTHLSPDVDKQELPIQQVPFQPTILKSASPVSLLHLSPTKNQPRTPLKNSGNQKPQNVPILIDSPQKSSTQPLILTNSFLQSASKSPAQPNSQAPRRLLRKPSPSGQRTLSFSSSQHPPTFPQRSPSQQPEIVIQETISSQDPVCPGLSKANSSQNLLSPSHFKPIRRAHSDSEIPSRLSKSQEIDDADDSQSILCIEDEEIFLSSQTIFDGPEFIDVDAQDASDPPPTQTNNEFIDLDNQTASPSSNLVKNLIQKSLSFFGGYTITPSNNTGTPQKKQMTLSSWLGISTPTPPPPTPVSPSSEGSKAKKGASSWWQGPKQTQATCPFYKTVPKTNFIVDGFKHIYSSPKDPVFFLTHFHSDHYGGLTSKFNRGLIYCSEITAKLVRLKLNVRKEWLRPLPMNTEVTIEGTKVLLLDANHCPGSVLILFKVFNESYLHTGDFRYDSDLSDHIFCRTLKLNYVFLDTTYCDPKYAFPPQQEIISKCLDNIEIDILRSDTIIAFGTYTIGKERIFLRAAERFNSKIYLPPAKFKIIECYDYPPETMNLFTNKPSAAKIHVVGMGELSYSSLSDYIQRLGWPVRRVVGVKPTGWTFSGKPSNFTRRTNKEGNVTVLEVPYSEHSSYAELQDFVRSMDSKFFVPTVNTGQIPDVKRALNLR